jgi:hypothetical protein
MRPKAEALGYLIFAGQEEISAGQEDFCWARRFLPGKFGFVGFVRNLA